MEMDRDKLLDYMFDQNSKLTGQLAGVREDLRLQREQVHRHHSDLKASLDRMEERAVAAERRAEAAEKRAAAEADARASAETQAEEFSKALEKSSLISTLKRKHTREYNCPLIINYLSLKSTPNEHWP